MGQSIVGTLRKLDLSVLFQILGGSLFIALLSQVKIPLLFTPVPLSLQTLAVMIIGAAFGRKKGCLCVAAYLAEISIGLPFAAGGVSAPLALIGSTGGYLFAFFPLAFLTGWISEKKKIFNRASLFGTLLLSTILVLAMGTAWLGAFVGWSNALSMGFYPFLIGDLIKTIAVTYYIHDYSRLHR